MVEITQKEWINWSGSVRFVPSAIEIPESEESLQRLVQEASSTHTTIRTVGASHSCSRIIESRDILLSMEKFKGLHGVDTGKLWATVGSGMTVEEVGECLFEHELGMENTGHINKQTIAGAISTGTHGAGIHLQNLSGQLAGVRLVTGTGAVQEYDEEQDPDMMQALKVALGSLGVFTQVRLKLLPAYQLNRRQYCASVADCIRHLDEMMEQNRNFCFYWYPRRDDVSIRTWNFVDEEKPPLPFATLYKEYSGWGKDVLPTDHELKYNELEYSVRRSVAVDCFNEVRARILERHRKLVGWRVLFRPVAADKAYLSNAYGYDSVAITIHQNASLPYQEYFDDIEQIFQAYNGRPHWGKKHSMRARELKKLFPEWERFHEIRRRMDPRGIFLNDYVRRVLIDE